MYMSSSCLCMFSELNAGGGSSALAGVIARNVEKTVQLFNMKCEQAVSSFAASYIHVCVHVYV